MPHALDHTKYFDKKRTKNDAKAYHICTFNNEGI